MTYLTKTAALTAALASALLLSTSLASAAPQQHRGHDTTVTRHDNRGPAPAKAKAGEKTKVVAGKYGEQKTLAYRVSHDPRRARNDRDHGQKFGNKFARHDGRKFGAHNGKRFDAHFAGRISHPDYDHRRFADRDHRPPLRFERAGFAPRADYRWHAGRWRWHDNQWVWISGIWRIALTNYR